MKVVVTGAEASGTRLVARVLGDCGELEVTHRSMPHGATPKRHWPTDRNFDGEIPDHLVIVSRDGGMTVKSQISAGHVTSHLEAAANITEAWLRLFDWIVENQVRFTVVNYEALILHSRETILYLADRLGIGPPIPEDIEDIYDGNQKYCEAEVGSAL